MSPLEYSRLEQHNDIAMTSDAEFELFLNTVNPTIAGMDRLAHATDWELSAFFRTVYRA